MILSVHTCTGNDMHMYSSWNYNDYIILHSQSKTSSFPLGFFTCKALYDFAAFQSIHYKLFPWEWFNSLQTFQEILSHCTNWNCSIKLEMLNFIPVLMTILMLLRINAQHFNCRLFHEDTLQTRLIYLIDDMIFDDSIYNLCASATIGVPLWIQTPQTYICACTYKHTTQTYNIKQ